MSHAFTADLWESAQDHVLWITALLVVIALL